MRLRSHKLTTTKTNITALFQICWLVTTKAVQYLHENKDNIVSGFNWAFNVYWLFTVMVILILIINPYPYINNIHWITSTKIYGKNITITLTLTLTLISYIELHQPKYMERKYTYYYNDILSNPSAMSCALAIV